MRTRLGLGRFARDVLGKPLYPYQERVGEAILDSVLHGKGLTFSVMFARQMGKNQLSAVLEAYLLTCMEQGTLVKAAPTFKPQIVTSRQRLLSMLDHPLFAPLAWRSYGYIVGVAPTSTQRASQIGPRILFFSAAPEANIVGATASLLLEVDEAQDVASDKFDRDLRPMASTTNSTTVLYGTAWSDDTLLALTRAHNLELAQRDGIQRHFEYDWRVLAAINPAYRRFVEGEMQRLGEEHPTIRTQYRLLPISGAGYLLDETQRYLLQGQHAWEDAPTEGIYIAGMDVGGEEQLSQGAESVPRRHDSTVITIGKIAYNEMQLPCIEVVHHYQWTGRNHLEQYTQAAAICDLWGVRKLVIDRTGLGEVLASLLTTRLGEERVQPFQFTRPAKSKLTYQFLSLLNSARLKLYRPAEAPPLIYAECWGQLKLARYRLPAAHTMDMYVDPQEGHDDFLISLALCSEALNDCPPPTTPAQIIKPRSLYDDGAY